MWRVLETEGIKQYIAAHEKDDVAALALAPFPFDLALRPLIIDQIKARQKARDKLPFWYSTPGIIFPSSTILEQASSEATAAYKARIAGSGRRFVDLTAGAGIDAAAVSMNFDEGDCVEVDEQAAALLGHNLPRVTRVPLKVIYGRAEHYVEILAPVDLAILDPQRRMNQGAKGRFRLEDGQPDATALVPRLANKASRLMLKASPMLDIAQAAAALNGLYEVHIVEWQGQCREALYLMAPGASNATFANLVIRCVAIDNRGNEEYSFAFTKHEENTATAALSHPRKYIFEPGPALMKGGCFNLIAHRFGVSKLHPLTHLYTFNEWMGTLPGRVFELISVLDVDKRAVLNAVPSRKAHLKIRNLPGESAFLQKKLGLSEGGDDQLFACTLQHGKAAILQTRRVLG